MSATSLMCTYLYGSLELIRAAIEGYSALAKGLLNRIESVATAAITVAEYMMDHTIKLIVDLVKQYEKELFDMLYNALLNQLLDPDSWLMKKLIKWWKKQCINVEPLNDTIRGVISDFSQFQQMVCSAGFTVEFGISYIKEFLGWCKDQLETYYRWLARKIRQLKKLCEDYLDQLIDYGVIDYLQKLCDFFQCAFDDSKSCAEIATASNFFNHSMSVLKLQKSGDSYNISTEYRNSIYGGLEGAQVQISNLKTEIDSTYKLCVDPHKLKNANNAYNLSKNIFPGGLEGDDLKWSNLKDGSWKKIKAVRYWSTTIDSFKAAWEQLHPGTELDLEELEDGTFTDENGYIYVKKDCGYEKLDLERLPEEYDEEVLSTESGDNHMMYDGEKFITVTEAAIRIAKDPTSDFAVDCQNLSSFINNWRKDSDGALRYNGQVLV